MIRDVKGDERRPAIALDSNADEPPYAIIRLGLHQ
jgi:hypothetical protein